MDGGCPMASSHFEARGEGDVVSSGLHGDNLFYKKILNGPWHFFLMIPDGSHFESSVLTLAQGGHGEMEELAP